MYKTFVLLLCVGISLSEYTSTTTCGFNVRKLELQHYCLSPGSRLFVGDFDGNKHKDLMCLDFMTGDMSVLLSTVSTFRQKKTSKVETCVGAKHVLLGDFNGDYRTDILCQLPTGEKHIYFSAIDGGFSTYTVMKAVTYSTPNIQMLCTQKGYKPVVGDFDGDRFDDYMCLESNTGYMSIIYGQENAMDEFRAEALLKDTFRCRGEIMTAKFNEDLKRDLVCYEKTNGNVQIVSILSDQVETMHNTTVKCTGRSTITMFTDIDGDGYDDLLCKREDKILQILRNTRHQTFYGPKDAVFYPKVSPKKIFRSIVTGDFNGDVKSDLVYHGFDGSLQLAESTCLKM